MSMPLLETDRLRIRQLTPDDLESVYSLLDQGADPSWPGYDATRSPAQRRRWLEWTVRSYEELAALLQPPYGERAVALKQTGELIGLVGYVPCLAPFGQLPSWGLAPNDPLARLYMPEIGLYYAFFPAYQQQGYATEAAAAMVRYAFSTLAIRRIVAMTTDDNTESIGVMRRLGMHIERNPRPDPPWFQVVGSLEQTS